MQLPPRPVRALYVADLVIAGLAVVNYLVAVALETERLDFLRSGVESNLPTWYATVQLALIGFVLLPVVWDRVCARRPRTWLLLLGPAFFFLLSLDEGAMVHERIGLWLGERGAGTATFTEASPWLFVLVPLYGLLAVAAFQVWQPYVRGRRKVVRLSVIGAALFGLSAAGLEALMFALGVQHGFMGGVMSVVEETGELVAATTLLWAALALAEAEGVRIVRPSTSEAAPRRTGA